MQGRLCGGPALLRSSFAQSTQASRCCVSSSHASCQLLWTTSGLLCSVLYRTLSCRVYNIQQIVYQYVVHSTGLSHVSAPQRPTLSVMTARTTFQWASRFLQFPPIRSRQFHLLLAVPWNGCSTDACNYKLLSVVTDWVHWPAGKGLLVKNASKRFGRQDQC